MKSHLYVAAFLLGMLIAPACRAQVPAGAPAGSTGQCKDGTYSTASSKKGACHGHQGVKTWFVAGADSATPAAAPASAAKPAAPAPAASPAPAAAPAAQPAKTKSAASSAPAASGPPAAGGGPGLVWLNTSSNVYHCYGTKYYGTTKTGKYVPEAQAKAAGAHPDHGKSCGQ
jgi:Protein of unknown function (DUF3761)